MSDTIKSPVESTAIYDNLAIADADAISWLGLDPAGSYSFLRMIINSAKQIADKYCNNDFADDDGIVTIPDAVKMGVYFLITSLWNRTPAAGGGSAAAGAITKQKAGDLEINYAATSEGSLFGVGPKNLPEDVIYYLRNYRIMPGGQEVVEDYGNLSYESRS